ncbi:MAG: ThiF family adenylyltransferase [Anaerolineaceae bacterium]|nr:ThiF family adenylyltransferase [Anaerolineaceae bacterium]
MISTEYLQARKLMVAINDTVALHLVGCGGTGSWLAPDIARVGLLLREKFQKEVTIVFQDPDIVEEKNIFRQNFCYAEIGKNKAETLAFRYGSAWGLNIIAEPTKYVPYPVGYSHSCYCIGCVDNADARRDMSRHRGYTAWLDCGNTRNAGQILLGTSSASIHKDSDPFALDGHCTWLPSPSVQHPELLVPLPEEKRPEGNISCADLAMHDSQGLSINKRIAAEAADFLIKMLITRNLKRYACYLDLESGSTRSLYITPNQLSQYLQEG